MSHSHTHSHDDEIRTYYLDQLCTVGGSAALGLVMVMLWCSGELKEYLNKDFHLPVLLAGVVLLIVAAIRGVSLWISVSKLRSNTGHHHDHDHNHGHEDCHDHDHCHDQEHVETHNHGITAVEPMSAGHVHSHEHDETHDHDHVHLPLVEDDHGHEHGWAPWRYAVMIVPVVIFMLGISGAQADPPEKEGVVVKKQIETDQLAENWKGMDSREREQIQKDLDGIDVCVRGLVWGEFDNHILASHQSSSTETFGKTLWLGRKQMTCCIGDAYPIHSRVIMELTPGMPREYPRNQWVKVIGKMRFYQDAGTGDYYAVVKAKSVAPLDRISSVIDP